MQHTIFSRVVLVCLLGASAVPIASAVPVASELYASGFSSPVFVTHAPGDATRLFVVEQAGIIKVIENGIVLGTPFLDISALVQIGGERGLLGLAFHPNYQSNGFFYVNYIDKSAYPGDTIIARYTVSGNPNVANAGSGFTIHFFDQYETNHNGGWMGFGPNDGYLYIASGDGGGGDDPLGSGQDINSDLGKILRLDVDAGAPYTPATNPFFGATPGNDRVWSYGLRNPWRCSFDRSTGDLWVADVGQGALEEVNFQDGASAGGENYGWDTAEGFECLGGGGTCGTNPGFTPPVLDYPRTDGRSVTGGYVYRGTAIAGLQGTYFYADFIFPQIWSFEYNGTVQNFASRSAELDPPGALEISSIASFGEDANGELYIVDYNGGEIFKIVGTDPDTDGDGLSDTAEGTLGTNPNDSDSDDDGLLDGAEVNTHFTNPLDGDSDNDTLSDGAEVNTHGTDPNDTDTDNDGLTDDVEVNVIGTAPNDSDSDNDGLNDGAEVNTHSTNPLDNDSDDDGLTDGDEVNIIGTQPNDSDTDNDGLTDGDEVTVHGSNPLVVDSDGDGLADGVEVNTYGSDPTNVDTDNDGLGDFIEVNTYSTDPTMPDTDGDGLLDDTEVSFGTDPLDPLDFPPVPALGLIGGLALGLIMAGIGAAQIRRRRAETR